MPFLTPDWNSVIRDSQQDWLHAWACIGTAKGKVVVPMIFAAFSGPEDDGNIARSKGSRGGADERVNDRLDGSHLRYGSI